VATEQGDVGSGSLRSLARRMVLPTALVLAVTLLLYGSPVPRLSEELYLPLVRRTADASYLHGDWTFAGNFSEHWVFDHLFAPVAGVLSVNAFGWLGRLVLWPVLGALLIRLGTRFGIGVWTAAGAVCLFLVGNQALFGGEWILGTFEAKAVAYVCLLGALLAITARKIPLGLALLGLTVTFHPAVGLWSVFAGGIALVAVAETRRTALRWCWLGILFAVPGVIEALGAVGEGSNALQRFVVLEAIPYHTDPFFDGRTLVGAQIALHLTVLGGMLAFNLWSYTKAERTLTQRFFFWFQIAAAVPFLLAFPARALHVWSYLRLMPLRSFPLIVPLLFFFQAFRWARRIVVEGRTGRRRSQRARRGAALVVVATVLVALFPTTPLLAGPRMVRRNFEAWTTTDHVANAFGWIREHTPTSTRCIVPVDRQDAFDRAERPIVANWQAIPYDRLPEWKRRIDALVGGESYFSGSGWHGDLHDLRAAYNRLSAAQVTAIARRYRADCFVTQSDYPFRLLHREGDVHIYRLTTS
jgi:hypothetical protein